MPRTIRPTEAASQSLFLAGENLEKALGAPGAGSSDWYGGVRAAIRSCTMAVENHLSNASGLAAELAHTEPRLLPSLERLEAGLAHLLVDLWEIKGPTSPATAADFVQRAGAILKEIRHTAGDEYALAWEQFNSIGGQE